MAYVKSLDSDKLGLRSDRCLFIGCPKVTKGYFFFLEDKQKVFITLRATFLEKEFLGEGTVASKVELSEIQQVEEPTHSTDTKGTGFDMIKPRAHIYTIKEIRYGTAFAGQILWFLGSGW